MINITVDVCETNFESDDSLVYATLETCICALLKRIPSLAPNLAKVLVLYILLIY